MIPKQDAQFTTLPFTRASQRQNRSPERMADVAMPSNPDFSVISGAIQHHIDMGSTSLGQSDQVHCGIISTSKANATFHSVSEVDVEVFKSILGLKNAMIDSVTSDASEDLVFSNIDWMRKYRGQTKLVLVPANVTEVPKILEHCNKHNIPVTPQGGNTGLVGGSAPVSDEVVTNLSRMNKLRSFDDVSGVLCVDTGVILEEADSYLKDCG